MAGTAIKDQVHKNQLYQGQRRSLMVDKRAVRLEEGFERLPEHEPNEQESCLSLYDRKAETVVIWVWAEQGTRTGSMK